jgi:hypothetical protein
MARIKLAVFTEADVTRMEGCIQTLAEADPKFRPKAGPIDYIAAQLGVSRIVVKEWVRNARPISRRTELTNLFWGIYERVAELLVEQLESSVWTTATTTGGRDALKAAMFLLPIAHPEKYGDVSEEHDESDVLNIADVEQEVFDAMTADDLEKLDRWQEKVVEIQENAARLIKEKRAKVLAAETASEDRVH